MRNTQDKFFDDVYFRPAMKWADQQGFTLPLSGLVIYDSMVHSGSILWAIRNMFSESPPAAGGNEQTWITEYVNARQKWLANHPRPPVRATVYRTECFQKEIQRSNWNLSMMPVNANGTPVSV